MYGYSPRVEKAMEQYDARESYKEQEWRRGPYIKDGQIVIPSPWYNKAAADTWKALGFRYRAYEWTMPMPGGMTEQRALEWARDQYAAFYPSWERPAPDGGIIQHCLRCDRQFNAEDEVQVLCPACEEEQLDWVCRRDVIEQPAIRFV